MGLSLLILVGAACVAWICGGTFGAMSALPIRSGWLVGGILLAQVGGGVAASTEASSDGYTIGLAVSAAFAVAFCFRNLRLAGVPLLTVGLALNALVVACNGAMPVSAAAAQRAGVSVASFTAGTDPRHVLASRTTAARQLGDVVPVPLPWRPEVASPGDVLVCAGLAELIVVAMRGRWRRRRQLDERAQPAVREGQAAQALMTMSRRS